MNLGEMNGFPEKESVEKDFSKSISNDFNAPYIRIKNTCLSEIGNMEVTINTQELRKVFSDKDVYLLETTMSSWLRLEDEG